MDTDEAMAVGVLGRGGEFELVPIDAPVEDVAEAMERHPNWGYCGVLAVHNGKACVRTELGPDAVYTMLLASVAFAQLAASRLRPKTDDRVAWLTALYSLSDTRG